MDFKICICFTTVMLILFFKIAFVRFVLLNVTLLFSLLHHNFI